MEAFAKLVDVNVDIDTTQPKIAFVQLQSSVKEKELVTDDAGTIAYEWKATANTETRKIKVLGILDWLHEIQPDINIVVFPEYSFPINQTLSEIKKRSDEYGFIVIAGSDSFVDETSHEITNRSPIVIPNRETVWITKREPSQWESSFVPKRLVGELPRFVWCTADGIQRWFMVYICLDYLTHSITDAALNTIRGPGFYIVPMCSPVMDDFHIYAGAHFRMPGGTATILSNCIGEMGAGSSSICAIYPGGRKSEPALRLSSRDESLCVFTLDLDQVSPPKVSTLQTRSPVLDPRIFTFDSNQQFKPSHIKEIHTNFTVRGVINPGLFEHAGKRMRVAFLGVQRYASTRERVRDQSFETLAVLGPSDLIITHVHQYKQNMEHEVLRGAGLLLRKDEVTFSHPSDTDASAEITNSLPFFEVERYFKVLGAEVDEHRQQIARIPRSDDLSHIVALGKNWYDRSVTEAFREKCLKNKWIIDKTDRTPGEINAVITIYLGNRTDRLARRLHEYEYRVLPRLVNNIVVTSCFGGTGHFLDCDFLLRVTTRVEKLFDFIEDLHKWTEESLESVTTRTFVVVGKLSSLSLDRVLRVQSLNPGQDAYAQSFFFPYLTDESRLRFETLPLLQQGEILQNYQDTQQSLLEIGKIPETAPSNVWSQGRLKRTLSNGIISYFYSPINPEEKQDGFTELKEVHDYLVSRVETILSTYIGRMSEKVFTDMKTLASVQSNRAKTELNYTDKVKICIQYAKNEDSEADKLEDSQSLFDTTKRRNTFAHGKEEELDDTGVNVYAETLQTYDRFLEKYW